MWDPSQSGLRSNPQGGIVEFEIYLTMVDACTSWPELVPIALASTENVTIAFEIN